MFGGGNDDDDDPYMRMGSGGNFGGDSSDDDLGFNARSSVNRETKAEKKARKKALEEKKRKVRENRLKTDDELLTEGLDTTPGGTVKMKHSFDEKESNFANFAKGVTDVLEFDVNDSANQIDLEATKKTVGSVDPLGETGGMVRFGSMEGDITKISNAGGNESKDDSLQAFLDGVSEEDEDDDDDDKSSEDSWRDAKNNSKSADDSRLSTPPPPKSARSSTETDVTSQKSPPPRYESKDLSPPLAQNKPAVNTSMISNLTNSTTNSTKSEKNTPQKIDPLRASGSPPPPPPPPTTTQTTTPNDKNENSTTNLKETHEKLRDSIERTSRSYSKLEDGAGGDSSKADHSVYGSPSKNRGSISNNNNSVASAPKSVEKERAILKRKERDLLEREEDLKREADRLKSWEREVRGAVSAAVTAPSPTKSKHTPSASPPSPQYDNLPLLAKIEELNKIIVGVRRERDVALDDLYNARAEAEELRVSGGGGENSDPNVRNAGLNRRNLVGVKPGEGVSKEELADVKRVIDEQETLIKGYQKENEKLLEEKQKMKEDFLREKGEIIGERERVNKRANKFENAFARVSASGGLTASMLMNRNEEGENDDPKSAESLRQEINRLKAEKTAQDTRNVELHHEIDKLRKEKKDALLQQEGLSERKLADSDRDVSTLKALITKERDVFQREIENLKKRCEWYIRNQELVDRDAEELRIAHETIAKLRSERGQSGREMDDTLASADGVEQTEREEIAKKRRRKQDEIKNKRIRDLEEQVRDLESNMVKRNPDSISNLIRAIGPSESVEVNRKETAKEVERLRKELKTTTEDGEKRMRGLKQQFDRVKSGLENEVERLKRKVKSSASSSSSVVAESGVGGEPSGGDLERVRAFYAKKISDMEKKHEASLRAAKRGTTAGGGGGSSSSRQGPKMDAKTAADRVRELEQIVGKQKEMILTLETVKGGSRSSGGGGGSGKGGNEISDRMMGQLEQRNKYLQQQVENLEVSLAGAETRVMAAKAEKARAEAETEKAWAQAQVEGGGSSPLPPHPHPPPPPLPAVGGGGQLPTATVEKYELRISELQRQLVSANNSMGRFQQELHARSQTEALSVTSEIGSLQIALQKVRNDLANAQNQLRAGTEENAELRRRLHIANHSEVSDSHRAQYALISKQVEAMERRAEERENEVNDVVKRVRDTARQEARQMQKLHEEEIDDKNRQIRRFRGELDELIAGIRRTGIKDLERGLTPGEL